MAALLAGAVVVGLVAHSYDEVYSSSPEDAVTSDRIATAVEALREEHVYVAPDGRDLMDAGSQDALEAHLETLQRDEEIPVYAVVWSSTVHAGYDPSEGSTIARQMARALEEDAVVVIWEGPGMALDNLDIGNGEKSVVAEGDAARRIAEFADALDPDDVPSRVDLDPGSDLAAGVVLGLGLAGLAYAALLGVVGLVRVVAGRRFLVAGPWTRS